jgi:putative sigma-54 modulation protein
MQLIVTGKNLEVTDWLSEYVQKKVSRLDRHLPTITDARVELSVQNTRAAKDRQVAQITLRTKRAVLRAEESSADMFASIDAALDKIERQISSYKGKRWAKRGGANGDAETVSEAELEAELEEETADEATRISRVKRFAMVPMDEEEAIDQLELLGHDFFVFFNVNANQINVVYRRRDGAYGLIQPDIA